MFALFRSTFLSECEIFNLTLLEILQPGSHIPISRGYICVRSIIRMASVWAVFHLRVYWICFRNSNPACKILGVSNARAPRQTNKTNKRNKIGGDFPDRARWNVSIRKVGTSSLSYRLVITVKNYRWNFPTKIYLARNFINSFFMSPRNEKY